MRALVTLAVMMVIALAAALLGLFGFWLGVIAFVGLTAAFVTNSIQTVPAVPPHKAVLTVIGERTKTVLDEGWNWLPLFPYIFNRVLVCVEKVTTEFGSQKVMTPDRANVLVSSSMTWKPGIDGNQESFLTFLNSGGKDGVEKIMAEIVADRIKTWAASNNEGPATWKEALELKDDALVVLAESILGDAMPELDNPIPVSTWMRFFNRPQSKPTEYDVRNGWGCVADGKWNWNGLLAIFKGYPADHQTALMEAVSKRKQEIEQMRHGKARFGDTSLGITILRFSVNEVAPTGEVAKAAERAEKERLETEAEEREISNVSDRMAQLRRAHPDMSGDKALEAVQVERSKARKTIVQINGATTGLGQDLLGLGTLIRGPAADSTTGEKSPKKERSSSAPMSDSQANRYLDNFLAGNPDEEDEEDEDENGEKK